MSIGSAVFAGLTVVTDRPTDRQTDHATQSVTIRHVCIYMSLFIAVRPNNIIYNMPFYYRYINSSLTVCLSVFLHISDSLLARLRNRTDHFRNTFPPVNLTFEHNPDRVTLSEQHLGQRSFRSKVK